MTVEELRRVFDKGLHDVCQPLTALQCRLYLGTTESEAAEMLSAIQESLVECERVMVRVRQLQERLEGFTGGTGDANECSNAAVSGR